MSVYETSITNPKKQLEFYKDLSEQLEKDNQELKNQLENQQKEFIEWLEKETKIIENKLNKYNELVKQGKETDIEYYLSIIDERIFDVYGKILSKYKEIIGGNNDQ